MSTEIFDRTEIVGMINSNCLDAEPGAGTVVLSPQKSGKSYLLEHIYRNRGMRQNTFYCWISVDALAAKVRPNEKLSDETFLRYFLKVLHEELCDYLARETEQEKNRRTELARDEARLKSGEIQEGDLRMLLEVNVTAVRGYLAELNTLRRYKDEIAGLLDAREQHDPFAFYELLDELLGKLKRMKKRVVVFIDDVHNIVGNHEFTETLLSTLRAASSDGRLIPLLSTPLQLMHPSLHDRKRGLQTRSLFNDLKVEVLNSFPDDDALKFLNWPKPHDIPLTEDEQKYILELAGGSPHFLKEVRDRYLRERPSTAADRQKFELEVGQAVAATLETIWNRCSQEQRDAIRAAQAAQAQQSGVDLGPVGCFARSQGGAFARLFENFLAGKREEGSDVTATPVQAFKVFPTALCIAVPEAVRPLLTVTVRNFTGRTAKVRLECELEQFSLPRSTVVDVPPGPVHNVQLPVTFRWKSAGDLRNPEPTQIRFKAELNPGATSRVIADDTLDVRVLAVDQFVFANKDEVENKLLNYSWLIAAWVNPEEPSVREMANKAAAEVAKQSPLASGYPAVSGPAAEEAVTSQVRELYDALKARGITYQNRTGAPFKDHFNDRRVFSQRVRLPSRSIKEGCANCLDGAVLFASLLAALDLDPLILFLPDHALVGWMTARGPAGEPRFLEITDVADAGKDFDAACRNGTARYEKVRALVGEGPAPEIADIGNFAILVNVRAAWQEHLMSMLPSEL